MVLEPGDVLQFFDFLHQNGGAVSFLYNIEHKLDRRDMDHGFLEIQLISLSRSLQFAIQKRCERYMASGPSYNSVDAPQCRQELPTAAPATPGQQ